MSVTDNNSYGGFLLSMGEIVLVGNVWPYLVRSRRAKKRRRSREGVVWSVE